LDSIGHTGELIVVWSELAKLLVRRRLCELPVSLGCIENNLSLKFGVPSGFWRDIFDTNFLFFRQSNRSDRGILA
jgi:hypothetical protein